jgi:hypothetical protein
MDGAGKVLFRIGDGADAHRLSGSHGREPSLGDLSDDLHRGKIGDQEERPVGFHRAPGEHMGLEDHAVPRRAEGESGRRVGDHARFHLEEEVPGADALTLAHGDL